MSEPEFLRATRASYDAVAADYAARFRDELAAKPLAASSSYSSAFRDVKSGSNGAYSAGTGYDKVTGWGSYNGAGFLSAELG